MKFTLPSIRVHTVLHRCRKAIYVLVILVLGLVTVFASQIMAQDFDLLLRGGHLMDPKNEINSRMDIAIHNGKIAKVASTISPSSTAKVIDVSGLYVTPGIVDIHSHNFYGTEPYRSYSNGFNAIPPDGFTFRAGVTTVVDAGGAGWKNFRQFKDQVIDRSQTRVLAFINIVGDGMSGIAEQNIKDMNPRMTALMAVHFPEIVGVKIAHFNGEDWRTTIRRSVEAGEMADVPVMVDFGGGRPPIEELFLELLRPGDIFTHTFHPGPAKEPVIDENDRVKPFVFDAQKKGIIFDVGHGAGSFVFRYAVPSFEQRMLPNTISSDLHASSMNAGMKDMANLMSKFLAIGMSLEDVIIRSTWNPAQVINRKELGHLSEGAEADIAVFNLKEGDFGFVDVDGEKLTGTQKLEAELTLKSGEIVWDLNGMSAPLWDD